eukprot:scaffold26786_cov205-Skeletonema_menzelii.AAC.2
MRQKGPPRYRTVKHRWTCKVCMAERFKYLRDDVSVKTLNLPVCTPTYTTRRLWATTVRPCSLPAANLDDLRKIYNSFFLPWLTKMTRPEKDKRLVDLGRAPASDPDYDYAES